MRSGNSMKAALALALAATAITSTQDLDFDPSVRGSFIMRDRRPARCGTAQHGKGKRRAKNKAARKMRKQQRSRS